MSVRSPHFECGVYTNSTTLAKQTCGLARVVKDKPGDVPVLTGEKVSDVLRSAGTTAGFEPTPPPMDNEEKRRRFQFAWSRRTAQASYGGGLMKGKASLMQEPVR